MIKVTDKEYWIDTKIKSHLDNYVYNAKDDWDFVFIVTGSGKTRVGKSCLACQLAYYFAYSLGTKFDINNIVFSGEELIERAKKYPKNSVFVYDEARAELDSKKALLKVNQYLYDFFAECGMLNHIIILVLPDFFELKRSLALGRSAALFNVTSVKKLVKEKEQTFVKFQRGLYFYYNEDAKRLLYLKGKKAFDDYGSVKAGQWGNFYDVWVVDEEEYNRKKIAFINRLREVERQDERIGQRDVMIRYVYHTMKLREIDISNLFKANGFTISRQTISSIVSGNKPLSPFMAMPVPIVNINPKGVVNG